MSLTVPHYLSVALNFLGFGWPEVDEDGMHEAAAHLRAYARDLDESIGRTHQRVTVELGQVYDAASYRALVGVWANQTRGHLDTMVEGCTLIAGALDVAADAVLAMKLAVIAQLAVALEEFLAIQAAAFVTFGASEAALPALYAVHNRILNGLVSACEAEIVEQLLDRTMRPVRDRIVEAASHLMYPVVASYVTPSKGMNVDTDAMRAHAAEFRREADGADVVAARLASNMSAISFTQGG